MGCGASKQPAAPAPGPVAFAAAKPLAPMTPTARAAAQARTVRLLESLAAKEERIDRPVLSNSERWRSGQRGMTRALLFGVKAFFEQHNALDKTMQDIVNEPGFPFSACELTKSTGLSLTETLVREAYREAGEGEGIGRGRRRAARCGGADGRVPGRGAPGHGQVAAGARGDECGFLRGTGGVPGAGQGGGEACTC